MTNRYKSISQFSLNVEWIAFQGTLYNPVLLARWNETLIVCWKNWKGICRLLFGPYDVPGRKRSIPSEHCPQAHACLGRLNFLPEQITTLDVAICVESSSKRLASTIWIEMYKPHLNIVMKACLLLREYPLHRNESKKWILWNIMMDRSGSIPCLFPFNLKYYAEQIEYIPRLGVNIPAGHVR